MSRSIIDRTLGQNKPRLYLALYPCGVVKEDDVKFHTSLLYVPKDPVSSAKETIRFHVVNKIVEDDKGDLKQEWEFNLNPPFVQNRTYSLRSVALLGKISVSEKKMKELLMQVPVKQDDKSWRCRHWVWEAMEHLAQENVIELPRSFGTSCSPSLTRKEFNWSLKEPVQCLDNRGVPIGSEIGI